MDSNIKNSDLILFFSEAFKRWGARSPKYMRIWRTINIILVTIGALPLTLVQLGLIIPPTWAKIVFGIISFCGLYGAAMNSLVVSKPVDLPLTEKLGQEKIDKNIAA